MTSWHQYFEQTKNHPPHKITVDAVRFAQNFNHALDIGSGAFRDSKFLVTKFKKVTAIDKEYAKEIPEGVMFYHIPIQEFNFEEEYDFVNAQFSLPFVPPDDFYDTWRKIKGSINHNGIFCGTFFGTEDEWASK